jgi:hypothetical protein
VNTRNIRGSNVTGGEEPLQLNAMRPISESRSRNGRTERPLRFELRYNAGEIHSRVAVAVAQMWKETLGVEVQLQPKTFPPS